MVGRIYLEHGGGCVQQGELTLGGCSQSLVFDADSVVLEWNPLT